MAKHGDTTRFLVLGLLREGRLSGYDIRRLTRVRFRLFWSESFGQIYPCLARLAEEGLVRVAREDADGRKRVVYAITPAGRRAFKDWLPRPAAVETMRYELLLKVYFTTRAEGAGLQPLLEDFKQRSVASLEELKQFHRDLSPLSRRHPNHASVLAVIRLGMTVFKEFASWAEETNRLLASPAPHTQGKD